MRSQPAGGRLAKGKSRSSSKRKPSASTSRGGQTRKHAGPSRASANPARTTSPDQELPPSRKPTAGGGRLWLYGRHAVEAALNNPRRTSHFLLATDEALARLAPSARKRAPDIRRVDRPEIDDKLGDHVVHQGLALAVAPLPSLSLEKICGERADDDQTPIADTDTDVEQPGGTTVLVLDRINDPHNLGAILRSAVAFGARAVIVPHRQSAELGGATAKAASGALDMIPIIEVTNLTRTLETLKDLGYWRAGLDGRATQSIKDASTFEKLALVLGAEATGIRRLVAEHCDLTVKLPISDAMESLNVSVACGIALYALSGQS